MGENVEQGRNADILQSIVDGTEYTDPPQSRIEDLLLQVKEVIEEGGGTKIKLADVSGAAVAMSFNTASLTWSDPEDIVVSGSVLAKWAGTKVLRKIGSAPESITDGVVVVDSKVKNQYSSSGYEDTGLEYNTMYYYRWFPYTEEGVVTDGSAVSATPARTKITTVPTQGGTLTYDGTEQTAAWNDYDSNKMTVSGDTGTNAGTYTAQFTPKAGYCWDDDSITAKSVSWVIDKATGVVTLSESAISLNADTTYADITVTTNSGGTLSVESSDPTVAAVGSIVGGVFRVTADEAGTATVTVTAAATTNYTAGTATASVSVVYTAIYGAEWDGTSDPSWTRTDAAELFTDPVPYVAGATNYGSPFDNLMPWAGMIKEERAGGTMVKIPKFWYKLSMNGAKLKVQIADGEVDGFYTCPACADRGDGKGERDYVYVGRYHCANDYTSKTGVTPAASKKISAFRTDIHNLGANIWQMDFAMRFTLWLLYLVEFAHWNSREKVGRGSGNNSGTGNMGYTDAMPYHTGTTQSSRDAYGLGTQYRNIEGLWDNVFDFCDGCYYDRVGLRLILNPNNFSSKNGSVLIGTPANGYPIAFGISSNVGFPVFYPTAAGGSDSTYSCDRWSSDLDGDRICYVGCPYYHSLGGGLFAFETNIADYSGFITGSRIMELP